MKSRIGKLEGDGRTSKRMQESLGKHVKILEIALKKEREKAKSGVHGDKFEEKKEEPISAIKSSPKSAMKRWYLHSRNQSPLIITSSSTTETT